MRVVPDTLVVRMSFITSLWVGLQGEIVYIGVTCVGFVLDARLADLLPGRTTVESWSKPGWSSRHKRAGRLPVLGAGPPFFERRIVERKKQELYILLSYKDV